MSVLHSENSGGNVSFPCCRQSLLVLEELSVTPDPWSPNGRVSDHLVLGITGLFQFLLASPATFLPGVPGLCVCLHRHVEAGALRVVGLG